MRQTRAIMGMPVTIEANGLGVNQEILDRAFSYLVQVDEVFSTYKPTSEISRINAGELPAEHASQEVQEVLRLAQETKEATRGFFDIRHDGIIDPSGLVKGWAITNAANILRQAGVTDFFVEAGGDIEVSGMNADGRAWSVGIRNPFVYDEVVKIFELRYCGIATSGTSMRGQHIYNPHTGTAPGPEVISLSVIGPSAYEADRFATAAFAMGREGINFIQSLPGFEGYLIDRDGKGISTSGLRQYLPPS